MVPTLDYTLLLMRILLEWRVVLRYSSHKEYPMGVGVGVAVLHIVCGESLSDCDWGLLKNAL